MRGAVAKRLRRRVYKAGTIEHAGEYKVTLVKTMTEKSFKKNPITLALDTITKVIESFTFTAHPRRQLYKAAKKSYKSENRG